MQVCCKYFLAIIKIAEPFQHHVTKIHIMITQNIVQTDSIEWVSMNISGILAWQKRNHLIVLSVAIPFVKTNLLPQDGIVKRKT